MIELMFLPGVTRRHLLWDGILTVPNKRKHQKYDKLCTKGKDLFYACGSDILGNLSTELDKFLSYMFSYIVHDWGMEVSGYCAVCSLKVATGARVKSKKSALAVV